MGGIADWLRGGGATKAQETRAAEPGADDPAASDFAADVRPPARSDAATDPVKAALATGMAFRAIQIHAISAKQISLDSFAQPAGAAQPAAVPFDEQQPWFKNPVLDDDTTRAAWIEQSVVSLATSGNCYWEIRRRKSDNAIVELPVLNPLGMTIEGKGKDRTFREAGTSRVFKASEIKHLKLLRVPGSPFGLGPIQAAAAEILGARDLVDFAAKWFAPGKGQPSGVLKSDQPLSPEQAVAAKARWIETQGATTGPAVLGQGLDYKPIYLSPKDAQFLESQGFSITQIARLFGVPASLMLAAVEGNSQSYANVAQDWLGYVRFSLMAYLIEIEEALSTLLPRRTWAKFNIEALLRSDTSTRYAAHAIAVDKWMTAEEIRVIEGLSATPALGEYRKPAAPVAPAPTAKEGSE